MPISEAASSSAAIRSRSALSGLVMAPIEGEKKHQTLAILKNRMDVRVEELKPLNESDTHAIIEGYLKRYSKRLSAEQIAALKAKPASNLPLYVLTALEELRTLGTYEEITERIRTLPGDARALFGWILTERLARDPGFRDREGRPCGAALVEQFAACLGVSRHGLSPAELTALLDPGDPLGNIAALLRLLRPYLMRRGELLDFYHGQFREAVETWHLDTPEKQRVAHQHLADYFSACAKGIDPQKEWETDSLRGFSECVFHLVKAGQHAAGTGLLSNFPFLLYKTRVGLLESVLEDYGLLRREMPSDVPIEFGIWADFFREKAHTLRRGNEEWPAHKILLQLVIEHADDSPLMLAAEQWLNEDRCNWLWLHRVPRLPHTQKNPCLAVLEGHSAFVKGALALNDGRILSWSNDMTLRIWDVQSGRCFKVLEGHYDSVEGALALNDGRILSWSDDNKTLRLWDGQSGQCLKVLEGHSDSVKGALALKEGRILSWSDDGTLRLWDGQSGQCLKVLKGHFISRVGGALALNDGRILSWSADVLSLWDVQTGQCIKVLGGHCGWVGGALALNDGRILSWADDELRLWDGQRGQCLAVLEGYSAFVKGTRVLKDDRMLAWSGAECQDSWHDILDGKRQRSSKGHFGHFNYVKGALALNDGQILSWSDDKTLRLWDGQSGQCLTVLEGHSDSVKGALVLNEGRNLPERRILSWSRGNTLRLWTYGKSGRCLKVLEGHSAEVNGALALSDGQILSWSDDRTLRIWDVQSGQCIKVLKGHSGWVGGALALNDGRILSWSDDMTVRIWDVQTGQCIKVLKGHSVSVKGALELNEGRILSWSGDGRHDSRRCLKTLNGRIEASR